MLIKYPRLPVAIKIPILTRISNCSNNTRTLLEQDLKHFLIKSEFERIRFFSSVKWDC